MLVSGVVLCPSTLSPMPTRPELQAPIVAVVRLADNHRVYGKADGGRGAEFSMIELFNGKMYAGCDRTGCIMEIRAHLRDSKQGWTVSQGHCLPIWVQGEQGKEALMVHEGDGNDPLPFKIEWSDQKNGMMVIGSTGKPHGPDVTECWIKTIGADMSRVNHIDARPHYAILYNSVGCAEPGYVVHEAARWSDVHQMWFFMPRKIAYTDTPKEAVFATIMLAVAEKEPDQIFGEWDASPAGEGVLLQEVNLPVQHLNHALARFVL